MKRCPECRRDYTDETLNFCLDDGTVLVDGPASLGDQDTAVMDAPSTGSRSYPELPTRKYEAGEVHPSAASAKRRFLWAAAVGGLIILAAVGYGIYLMANRVKEKPEHSSKPIEIQRLTGDGRTRNPTISPDGKFLVFTKLDEGKESLWIKQIQTGSAVNVVKPGEATGIFGTAFSPDGNFVYFNANLTGDEKPTIYRVPTLGGTPLKFLENALFIAFSGDGKHVSFRRDDLQQVRETIIVANADGSDPREIASRQGKQFFTSPAAWSPDGKMLAAAIGDDDRVSKGAAIGLYEVEGGNFREFVPHQWDLIDDLAWHPSGDSLLAICTDNAFIEGRVFEIGFPSGETRQLTNDVNGHYGISLTADGNSVVTGERYARSAVWVSPDLKPENAKQVMPATGDTWGLSWMPDGRIVYASDQTGYPEIWIMNSDGSDARSLTNDRIFKSVPYPSPDARFIVYTSSNNSGQIERINNDGSGMSVLSKTVGADNPQISGDGQWVIYSAYANGIPHILRVSINGGDEKKLMEYPANEPRYSNDGKWLACFLLVEKTLQFNRLAIVPADGGEPVKTFDIPSTINTGRGPVWTPDDKGITLINALGEKQNLWLQPTDGSPGRAITDFQSPGIARREYSRDGKRIAIVRAEGISNAIMITGFR
jgi:Tol biopolymer transport system component